MKKPMPCIVTTITIALLLVIFSTCYAMTEREGLNVLRYIELRILAVDVEVLAPLGWSGDDKKSIKLATDQALKELKILQDELVKLDIPKELEPIRTYHLGFIDRMNKLYAKADKVKPEEISKDYADIRNYTDTQHKDVDAIYGKSFETDKLPKDFVPINEETRLATSLEDKSAYLTASKLISERKFKGAYAILKRLEPKYQNTVFGSCVTLRISDCIISHEGVDGSDPIKGEEMLAVIVNSRQYSPILSEAFEKWRSVVQANNHGMSNMSIIPNDEYNTKRWELVQLVKGYLKNNPSDVWAGAQVELLLSFPNIGRGGQYGNDNLLYYARLYSDVLNKKVEEK